MGKHYDFIDSGRLNEKEAKILKQNSVHGWKSGSQTMKNIWEPLSQQSGHGDEFDHDVLERRSFSLNQSNRVRN